MWKCHYTTNEILYLKQNVVNEHYKTGLASHMVQLEREPITFITQ